ncbi:hypothetical protein SCA50_2245 [Salmonella enterica subsp. enterica serovar Choleraesuis str. SCSA50]|uniref:Uncharacterized protein n=1 Tax=Salmonella enterica subsp. enterica serovar Choleraesuis str. SCSA50 TaxID=904139 RepID=A0AAJ8WKZ1_SALET|nr:hypothetical protein SCA50_2245 [Salmonella enterica subsp. enterica serovar Choleraesuis str. SCSA50]
MAIADHLAPLIVFCRKLILFSRTCSQGVIGAARLSTALVQYGK